MRTLFKLKLLFDINVVFLFFSAFGGRIKIDITKEITESTPIIIKVGSNPPRSAPMNDPASAPNPKPWYTIP